MHPILLDLGFIQLPSYGVLLVGSFLLSAWLLKREAPTLGLDPKKVVDVAVIGLLFGLIGAKLLLIVVELPHYIEDPKRILGTIRSAGVIYGGLILGAVGSIWYIRKLKLTMLDTLDLMAPFSALAVGLGRVSCLAAGCCYGSVYEGPFALTFPDHPLCHAPAGVSLFPIQIVGLINGIVLCVGLVYILRRRAFPGQVIAAYGFLYSLTRGLMEFLRGDAVRGEYFDGAVSTSQIIAVVVGVISLFLYFKLQKGANS